MTVMAIFQEVDKCMRCGGCTIACKREWGLKNFTDIETVKPQRSVVNPRQRLAIKSQKRVDMGPFIRFSCWHCPDPPCAKACPLGAITKEANGAVSVDNTKCDPSACSTNAIKPCEIQCQRGGYPKVGDAYEATPGVVKMNKCTLCSGRAGEDDPTKNNMLPTTATQAEIDAVPEKAHMPACVSTCPAKAMRWDTRENLIAFAEANYYLADGTKNWYGNGSMMWGSKKVMLTPAKADPFIEDHITPMTSSMLSGSKMILPTLVVGGLAALSARRVRNEADAVNGGEV